MHKLSKSANKPFTFLHGLTNHRLHRIYRHIKDRCNNPKNESYSIYGAKGVQMCKSWSNNFMAFYKWALSHGYSDDLTIDRKKIHGNYSPVNCRWIDRKGQGNNRSTNRFIKCGGQTQTLRQWAEETGINEVTLRKRLRKGWPVNKALNKD